MKASNNQRLGTVGAFDRCFLSKDGFVTAAQCRGLSREPRVPATTKWHPNPFETTQIS